MPELLILAFFLVVIMIPAALYEHFYPDSPDHSPK